MSQQQITVMWVPGAEDGGAMTRVISVPMFNKTSFGRFSGAVDAPYHTYEIPVPDTAKVTWMNTVGASSGRVTSPTVIQKTVSTAPRFRFSKANALVAAIMVQGTPSLFYGPSVSLTGATKIFDGSNITLNNTTYLTGIPTITDVQLPNKYLLVTSATLRACVVIEDDNPIRA